MAGILLNKFGERADKQAEALGLYGKKEKGYLADLKLLYLQSGAVLFSSENQAIVDKYSTSDIVNYATIYTGRFPVNYTPLVKQVQENKNPELLNKFEKYRRTGSSENYNSFIEEYRNTMLKIE